MQFSRKTAVFLGWSLLTMTGCGAAADPAEPADSAEVDTAEVEAPEAEPESELPKASPEDGLLKEPPTGNYRVERVAISDTCVWARPEARSEPRTLAVISHFAKDRVVANVPAVLGPQGAAQVRMDLELVAGKQIQNRRAVCDGGTSTFRSTVLEVGAKSFSVRVERGYEGIESCVDQPDSARPRPTLPQASCASVEELRFELEGALCPARCAFKPSFQAGVLAGTCNCGRG